MGTSQLIRIPSRTSTGISRRSASVIVNDPSAGHGSRNVKVIE
jgi:hypothetical protein